MKWDQKKKTGEFVEMTNVVDSQLVAGMNKDLCCNNSNNRVGTVQIFITRLQQVMRMGNNMVLVYHPVGIYPQGAERMKAPKG